MDVTMFLSIIIPLFLACGDNNSSTDECPVIVEGEDRVVIGFWETDDCSGDPMITNSFPIDPVAECYCWPGNSGENSADSSNCNDGDGSFTYTQYGSLDCGESDDSPTQKTMYTDSCTQDIPPTIYSMIIDYSACE
jgi:hypothetical protein